MKCLLERIPQSSSLTNLNDEPWLFHQLFEIYSNSLFQKKPLFRFHTGWYFTRKMLAVKVSLSEYLGLIFTKLNLVQHNTEWLFEEDYVPPIFQVGIQAMNQNLNLFYSWVYILGQLKSGTYWNRKHRNFWLE